MSKQEGNFTKIPNVILDDLNLNPYEFRVLMHIARQTIGFGKKSDGISLTQFVKFTGMSKSKLIKTIKSLSENGLIRIAKQINPGGGKSFNKYTLTLVSDKHQHSVSQTLEVVSDKHQHSVSQTLEVVSDKHIQKKIEQKKIDKRRERENMSAFFSISDESIQKEIDGFLNYVSIEAHNPTAYRAKLRKQLSKEHTETLEEFETWYLQKESADLNSKYSDQLLGAFAIESIYTYKDTDGYDSRYKFIMQMEDPAGEKLRVAYPTSELLEFDLMNGSFENSILDRELQ